MKEFNIVVVGVGGQGVMTLGITIAEAALMQGYDVRTTEVHGLAQRGGSIPLHVRFGEKIYSSLVPQGKANLIISLEPLEALRAAYYGSKESRTTFLIDDYRIPPITVSAFGEKYPTMENIVGQLKPFSEKVIVLDASKEVEKQTGSILTSNIFILGYLVSKKLIPLEEKTVLKIIEELVPPKYLEMNKKVFEMGKNCK